MRLQVLNLLRGALFFNLRASAGGKIFGKYRKGPLDILADRLYINRE